METLYKKDMIAYLKFELNSSDLTIAIAHNPGPLFKIKSCAKQTFC